MMKKCTYIFQGFFSHLDLENFSNFYQGSFISKKIMDKIFYVTKIRIDLFQNGLYILVYSCCQIKNYLRFSLCRRSFSLTVGLNSSSSSSKFFTVDFLRFLPKASRMSGSSLAKRPNFLFSVKYFNIHEISKGICRGKKMSVC